MSKFIDRTGQRYGKLVAVKFIGRIKNRSMWLCKCDCGNYVNVSANHLHDCSIKSCGCSRTHKNLIGYKKGRLTVIEYAGKNKNNANLWLCKCDCGNTSIVTSSALLSGTTYSCGCLASENVKMRNTFHGQHGTRLYRIWNLMIQRCENIKSSHYDRYGGRGIFVCEQWHKFIEFYNWAISNGYNENLTIDRIDNNKGYSPDNCRWVTIKEQQNNRENNRKFMINGELLTVSKIAEKYNIKYNSLMSRIKRGWSIEKAVTTPINTKVGEIIKNELSL